MITIEALASIGSHKINWLFDGKDEADAVQNAKLNLSKKGLKYHTYVLV